MAKAVCVGILLSILFLTAFVRPSPLFTGICIKNCAQCKEMYGKYFYGQLCADSCVKYKGSIIPNCEDIASIAPFLILNDDLS
ncbi:putative eclosion hormone [Trypoxylus dichotomus]